VVVRVVQAVDGGEERLHVHVLGLAGVEDVLLVLGQRVAQHQLDLEQRHVHGVGDRALHLDLEGLADVDHRGQAEAAQLQRRAQADLQPGRHSLFGRGAVHGVAPPQPRSARRTMPSALSTYFS
jgi:hypothetical protein